MSTPITELELTVLAWVSSDYEAIHTIDKKVSEEAGRKVFHDEIHRTLVALSSRELAISYVHNEKENTYVQATVKLGESIDKYWWLATIAGQHVLEMEPESP